MELSSTYDEIMRVFLAEPARFDRDYPTTDSPSPANLLILSLKKKWSQYETFASKVDRTGMDPKGEEVLLLLESKIYYFGNHFPKQVYTKKRSPKWQEFVDTCNEALAIYPNAFWAARSLAWLYQIHDKPREAYELLTRIWQHGFRSNGTADHLVFLSTKVKDWENGNKYASFPRSIIYRILLRVFCFILRHQIIWVFYFAVLITAFVIKPWLILLGAVFVLGALFTLISVLYKSFVICTIGIMGMNTAIWVAATRVLIGLLPMAGFPLNYYS